jgi:hypothetical protein
VSRDDSLVRLTMAIIDVIPPEEHVNRCILILLLSVSVSASALTKPTEACTFDGFAAGSQEEPNLAEVSTKTPARMWTACDSSTGCFPLKLDPGSPVLIYRTNGEWTCGYGVDRHGAAPAWFRTRDLRPLNFTAAPPIEAWYGVWKCGEDRVAISASKNAGELRLVGNAIWQGANRNEHFGHAQGNAVPSGNRLHIVDGGCVIDLTLAGKYILADDNQGCGGMNVSFSGFWKRAPIGRATTPKP